MTKRNGVSLYNQVKEKILADIKSGHYNVSKQIPTEYELCDLFKVSRTTIRQALNELETEGFLERTQGRGTFIKKKEIIFSTNKSFSEDIIASGKRPSNKIIEASVIAADQSLSEILQIPLKTPVTKLVRIRYADGEPIIYETSFIPWSLAPGLANDAIEQSLYTHLQTQYNLKLLRSIEKIKAVLSDEATGQILDINAGTPCFSIHTMTYLVDNTPIEYNYGIARGDFPEYKIERFF
jgi:GntR family transcriptional regulator